MTEWNDEQLTAYLDGELSADESAEIGQDIKRNAELQQRVETLRQTWSLLDDLPEEPIDKDLTRSTIEMVALSVDKDGEGSSSNRIPFAIVALVASCLGASLLGVFLSSARQNRVLNNVLSELPALYYYDELVNIKSKSWLEKIVQNDQLSDLVSKLEILDAGQLSKTDSVDAPPESIEARQMWLEGLSADAKNRMAGSREKLRRLPKERRDDLIVFSEIVRQADTQTKGIASQRLAVYLQLLSSIGPSKRTAFTGLSDAEKANELQNIVRREVAIDYARKLTFDDRIAFEEWLSDSKYYGIFDSGEIAKQLYYEAIDEQEMNGMIGYFPLSTQELLSELSESDKRGVLGLWIDNIYGVSAPSTIAELKSKMEALPVNMQDELEFLPEEEARYRLESRP